MSNSRHTAWVRHLDAIGDELLRLATVCEVRLREPGVVERILKNDDSVCGRKNPIGFRKLHDLVIATFASTDKALDRLGPEETKLIVDTLLDRLESRMALGGTKAKSSPAVPGKTS